MKSKLSMLKITFLSSTVPDLHDFLPTTNSTMTKSPLSVAMKLLVWHGPTPTVQGLVMPITPAYRKYDAPQHDAKKLKLRAVFLLSEICIRYRVVVTKEPPNPTPDIAPEIRKLYFLKISLDRYSHGLGN